MRGVEEGNNGGKILTGVEGLDRLLGHLELPYLLVVAGHPGAGKTTLASTICYRKVVDGGSCLYISFHEDREKLFRYMSKLGLDLAGAESTGRFKYVKLPLSPNVERIIGDVVSSLIAEGRYDVIVIDSINALLSGVRSDAEKRAWLTNYFYSIPVTMKNLLILLAEVPFGSERLELGGLDFVADGIVFLKHRLVNGFLLRILEVRKARGASITIAEVPFTITEGRGIEVWTPSILEYVSEDRGEVRIACKELKDAWNHLHRGHLINIVYPADSDYIEIILYILGSAIVNDMKILMVSYKYSPQFLMELLIYKLHRRLGVSIEKAKRIVSERLKAVGINPFAYSVSQLVVREIQLVESEKPDVIVFHGVEIPRAIVPIGKHVEELYNQMNYLKQRGYLVIRLGAYTDPLIYRLESGLADAIMRFKRVGVGENGTMKYKAYIWRRGTAPRILSSDALNRCAAEIEEIIKKYAESCCV